MLGVNAKKRNETRHRAFPWEDYNLGGMMNTGKTRINDNTWWHMFHISGADSSVGIQKSSLWGAVMGGSSWRGRT